ncbi:MAG: hypothetical protein DI537_20380 [Stutzerimonas stutzeri]|nr:MAG: hypothetical protein DI537_20380 [Stutzerimonas stutzeri]
MGRTYTPRRQSKRWLDTDCPAGVLAIYDNRGESADRYTVIYREPISGTTFSDMYLWYRGMSENPFHPQGVGMSGEFKAYECAAYRYRERNRAGKWSTLPDAVKKCVLQDLAP